jgi:hypothetical protein
MHLELPFASFFFVVTLHFYVNHPEFCKRLTQGQNPDTAYNFVLLYVETVSQYVLLYIVQYCGYICLYA